MLQGGADGTLLGALCRSEVVQVGQEDNTCVSSADAGTFPHTKRVLERWLTYTNNSFVKPYIIRALYYASLLKIEISML